MRLAVLSRSAHPLHGAGGLERAVLHHARHVNALGVEIVLLTRPPLHAADFPGRVVALPYARLSFLAHGGVLDRLLHYPAFARRVGEAAAALVRSGQAEIVHAHGIAGLGYARLRGRDGGLRAPLVLNPHGMEEHKATGLKRMALSPLRRLSRETARLADAVIATDRASVEEVERLLGVERQRIHVLPNGVDMEEIARVTPGDPAGAVALGLPGLGSGPLLLSVGRLVPYKGFLDVAAALRSAAGLPEGWRWVVVGDGPAAGALREACSPLAEHVVFAGVVPEALLHALYERAAVFVHVPHYEGSSIVTLEALAHGRPVVATPVGGIPDKVADDQTGVLVPPGEPAALARALGGLLAEPARARRLGERGRERVVREFAWPAIARRTLGLYEALLAGRS